MDTFKIKGYLTVHTKGEGEIPGVLIGTVEHIDGEKYIKLIQSDSLDGQHHWIHIDWLDFVDDQAIYLNKTHSELIKGAFL